MFSIPLFRRRNRVVYIGKDWRHRDRRRRRIENLLTWAGLALAAGIVMVWEGWL